MANESYSFWRLISDKEKLERIEIPEYQRDYAQGRPDDDVEQIRSNLLNDLYSALVDNDKNLVLNFVYGEMTSEKHFIPVDGQQRLTTLFLLHYYVFARMGMQDELNTIARFQYMIRTTSQRFCENLCSKSVGIIRFEEKNLTVEIQNQPWCTKNIVKDPTVESMLCMLQDIHEKFGEAVSEKGQEICDRLLAEDCPVTFLWIEPEKIQKANDVYIKMNARGKILSDFEIFKSKLQGSNKVDSKTGKEGALYQILSPVTDSVSETNYISKYNNEFTELFYHFYQVKIKEKEQDGTEKEKLDVARSLRRFDRAMMEFIAEFVRDAVFAQFSRMGVGQKEYRDYYMTDILSLNGSRFYNLVEKGEYVSADKKFRPAAVEQQVFVKALKRIYSILEALDVAYANRQGSLSVSAPGPAQVPSFYIDYGASENAEYDLQELFLTSMTEETSNPNSGNAEAKKSGRKKTEGKRLEQRSSVIKFAMMGFIGIYGYPNTADEYEAYYLWRRFVHNMTNSENQEMKNADNAVELIVFFDNLLEGLKEEQVPYSVKDIQMGTGMTKGLLAYLGGITNPGKVQSQKPFIKRQLEEEKIKCQLMYQGNTAGSAAAWKEAILDAETYFGGGCVIFLLDFSFDDSQKIYVLDQFIRYRKLSQLLLDGDKKVLLDWRKTEKALLCMTDISGDDNTAQLLKADSAVLRFWGDDYLIPLGNRVAEDNKSRSKRLMFKELLDEIEKQKNSNPNTEIENWLENIINQRKTLFNQQSSTNRIYWKEQFIHSEKLWGYMVKGECCFCLTIDDPSSTIDTKVLLLSKSATSSYNQAMQNIVLAEKLEKSNMKISSIESATTADLAYWIGNPFRFFHYYGQNGSYQVGYVKTNKKGEAVYRVWNDAGFAGEYEESKIVAELKKL